MGKSKDGFEYLFENEKTHYVLGYEGDKIFKRAVDGVILGGTGSAVLNFIKGSIQSRNVTGGVQAAVKKAPRCAGFMAAWFVLQEAIEWGCGRIRGHELDYWETIGPAAATTGIMMSPYGRSVATKCALITGLVVLSGSIITSSAVMAKLKGRKQ